MTTTELDQDLAQCSPFYADQFRARRKRWATEDRATTLADLKFYRAMKKQAQEDSKLNDISYDNLLPVLDQEIARCVRYISNVVMTVGVS